MMEGLSWCSELRRGGVGGFRASPACCARVPFAPRRGGLAVCFVFLWVPASAGMTDGLRE